MLTSNNNNYVMLIGYLWVTSLGCSSDIHDTGEGAYHRFIFFECN